MNPIKKVFETSDLSTYIAKYAYEPKTYYVYEDDTNIVQDYLNIGNEHDKICYMTYNQMGCIEYKIIIDDTNTKKLRVTWSAEDFDFDMYEIVTT